MYKFLPKYFKEFNALKESVRGNINEEVRK
jgi:hypothetical protein